MNMKKIVRKVVAIGTGAAMVGATLMGAMATNLNEYPAPFVQDGVFDAVLVIGDQAQGFDNIGLTDIAMALQASSYVEETVETSEGTTTVSDGVVEDELELGVAFGGDTYDDGDITVLKDDSIRYNSEDYDYEEQIIIGTSALTPESAEANDDFEDVPALVVSAGTYDEICYKYQFGDLVPHAADEELEFEFLGLDLTITAVAADEVSLSTATEVWMDYGEELAVTIEGVDYTITLGTVYDEEALITVNGVTEAMAVDDVEDFGFEDFEIEMLNVLNDDGIDNDAGKIKYGSTVSEVAKDGEAAEMLGYGDDDVEAEWVWAINSSAANNIDYIGVCYNQDRDEIAEELDEDYELPVLLEGDSIMFPNDFASIEFAAVSYDTDMSQVTIEYDNSKTFKADGASSNNMDSDEVWAITSDDEVVTYDGEDYKRVYILHDKDDGSFDICMEDSNGNKDCNASFQPTLLGITVDDELLDLVFDHGASDNVTDTIILEEVSAELAGDLVYDVTVDTTPDGEATDDELFVDANGDGAIGAAEKDLSTTEENFMLDYGVIVQSPEDNLEAGDFGKIVLSIPKEDVTVDIAIAASASVAATSGTTTQTINVIQVGATKFASEVTDITAQNAIVVGGPAVNMAAAELLGNPSQEEILTMFTPGKAMVKLFENGDNVAMLVAGYDGEDTRTACKIVANGAITEVDGMNAEVITTSEVVTAPVVVVEEPVVEEPEETTEE